MWETPPLNALEDAVLDPSSPIGMRMRAAYFLRQYYDNAIRNEEEVDDGSSSISTARKVIDLLSIGLRDPRHGALLRHEFAYVMGQLRDERCCPALEAVLMPPDDDGSSDIMVRHECGEALGAIGAARSVPVLERAVAEHPDSPEIGQTCQLALDHLLWRAGGGDDGDVDSSREEPAACACMLSPYSSVDPAPPHPSHATLSVIEVGDQLRDPARPLFERYRAMFSLRNRGGEEATKQLGLTLTKDQSSALLRHEVAYVLGQMQHPAAVDALAESLRRPDEHAMVRHESAEALGAIEGRWDDCENILTEFLNDPDVIVRESCAVALDAADYWGHGRCDEGGDTDVDKEEKDSAGNVERDGDSSSSTSAALSFVRQKAVTNGKGKNDTPSCNVAREGRLNHFNVAI